MTMRSSGDDGHTAQVALARIRSRSWSPWAVGAGIGVASWFAFAFAGHGLGITTAFEQAAALLERVVAPGWATAMGFFDDHPPQIGWYWTLVLGVFLGSLASSRLSGDERRTVVPRMWADRFGPSVSKRMGFAFIGGAVMMIGARLAMGCTSGHGLTGALQLAVSSWVFVGLAFTVAIGTAFLMYRGRGGARV